MFILAEPYLSDIALDYISSIDGSQVIATDFLKSLACSNSANFCDQSSARKSLLARDGHWIYTNSENSLGLIDTLLPSKHRLKACIELFKNKHRFREHFANTFTDIEYRLLTFTDLLTLSFSEFGHPFIIKPTIGFLSLGVYKINSQAELSALQSKIAAEMQEASKTFPKSVIDSSAFIVENVIAGEEFAIDAYFTETNQPIIINIFKHIFRDETDMSDRLYLSSCSLIQKWLNPFTDFLQSIASGLDLGGFAMHAEVRVDASGVIRPIEINPLRFAGWCCTDLAHYAYGINPYRCFAEQIAPDWNKILAEDTGKDYAMSVLSSPLLPKTATFDYASLASKFSDLKELRKIDHTTFPIFGFVFFALNPEDTEFCTWLLTTDFAEFCH